MTYTPTTSNIRDNYAAAVCLQECTGSECPVKAGFDRWLAEVKAQALEEAASDPEIQDNRPWVEWWLRNRAQQLKENK